MLQQSGKQETRSTAVILHESGANNQTRSEVSSTRKQYDAPRLQRFGTVEELTNAVTGGSPDDGFGGGPGGPLS